MAGRRFKAMTIARNHHSVHLETAGHDRDYLLVMGFGAFRPAQIRRIRDALTLWLSEQERPGRGKKGR